MVVGFYFIVFVLSLVMLASFLIRYKKVDTLLIMFCAMVSINCLGRYVIATSESLEMAFLGTKILYIGACYAPLMTVFIIARLCEHKLPAIAKIAMILYSTVTMILVFTIGKSGIYYKSATLVHGDGYNYLEKVYGPAHKLYPIMMLIYAVIMMGYIVYTIKNRNKLSFRIVSTLCVCCFSIVLLYIVEKLTGISISFISIGYLIGIALLTNYFDRLNAYDMSSNIISTLDKMMEYGYIVFDDKYRYVNSNKYLREQFPEISDYSVDCQIPQSDSLFHREVIEFLYGWEKEDKPKKTIRKGDTYYELEIRTISQGKKDIGYLIEFVDRTMEMRYYSTIEDYNASLKKEVNEQTKHIMHIKDMMVLGMADMVESRDNSTGGHIKRTSAVVKVFAKELEKYTDVFGFDHEFLKAVERAAPMHDLGKIAIDDEILRKPGKYTPEEFDKMKKHAQEGARIVGNILEGVEDESFVKVAKNVANYHHEKWNGKGYPKGLSGLDIPVEARIMALADVFDALVSKRCYKEAFSYDKAFQIIEESLGEHFDPMLGRVFMKCRPELENIYDNYSYE